MAPIPIGIFSQGASGKYWIASTIDNPTIVWPRGNRSAWKIDPTNTYLYNAMEMVTSSSSTFIPAIVKYDLKGNIIWQKSMGTAYSGVNMGFKDIHIDSSGNIYAVGKYYYNTGGTPSVAGRIMIVKFNSSGVIQWQKYYQWASEGTLKVAATSTDLIITSATMSFTTTPVSGGGTVVAKISMSTGAQTWARTIADSTSGNYPLLNAVDVDSAGNIYLAGERFVSATSTYTALAMKLTSTGTTTWVREYTGTGPQRFNDVVVINDVPIVGGGSGTAFASVPALAKLSATNGDITWQKNFTEANTYTGFSNLRTDASGYIYASSGLYNTYKLSNTDGSVLLARAANGYASGVEFDGAGNMVLYGNSRALSVPTDGSLTGTYSVGGVSITYGTASYTNGTAPWTAASNTTTTNGAYTLTETTLSLTTSDVSITWDLVPIG